MKTVVAIQHVAFENLGSFEPVLREQGYQIAYLAAWEPAFAARLASVDADLLVVLGGPVGVYKDADYPFLSHEVALIRQRVREQKAVLGICLGAQLIAAALGGQVYSTGSKEIGWGPLTLTTEGADSALRYLDGSATPVLHWHGDTFTLPDGAVRLASTAACENQAFAVGRHVLALQFHAEVRGDIEAWLIGHACEIGQAGLSVAQLRDDTSRHIEQLTVQAARLLDDWLKRAVPT